MSTARARELALLLKQDLDTGDPTTDWQRNGNRLRAIVQALIESKKAVFDRLGEHGQEILLGPICDYTAWKLVQLDKEFKWNFGQGISHDTMSDPYEDVFLYAYGHSLSRYLLTGQLKML